MNSCFEQHKDSIRWHCRCSDDILIRSFSNRSGSSALQSTLAEWPTRDGAAS
jgi:hypothetical protein